MKIERALALTALTLTGLLTACAPGGGIAAGSEDAEQEEDALSGSSRTFVTIRRDFRKCMAPLCGGYWVQDVNRKNPSEQYVSALEFGDSGLDEATIGQILTAGDGELVLRGKLGAKEQQFNTRTFRVYEAYRGMPGHGPVDGDAFYSVEDLDIQCFTAPCDTLRAKLLNHTEKTSYTGTDTDLGGGIYADWLAHRVAEGGALVAGTFRDGEQMPGGLELILDASQVYLRLPEVTGDCPLARPSCEDGTVPAYTYSVDRCVVYEGCVESGACIALAPTCDEGYTPVSWPSAPFGCSAYVCEPLWMHPEVSNP